MTEAPESSPGVSPVFSPLHAVHVAAGASFTDFAGWQMPVRYSSDLAEHRAVRTAAGIFDLSHMAEILVAGPESAVFLDYALAGELSATALGQAKYSLLLSERGGIVDDVVVYRTGTSEFLIVANAGNHVAAFEALVARSEHFDVEVSDQSDRLALIAVQGPRAREIVMAAPGIGFGRAAAGDHPLGSVKYYWSLAATYANEPLLVARTGYTGEDGFELYVPTAHAVALWNELVAAGQPFGLVPAGLAARDTLRLEAGMPLYGHELSLHTRPEQAGLGRVVNFTKGDFVGRGALESPATGSRAQAPAVNQNQAQPPEGAAPTDGRVLAGLVGEGKRAARAGYEVFETPSSAAPIGVVTSGVLSPTLGVPVAMAYLDPSFTEPGTDVVIDVRGTRLPFTVTPVPFYRRKRD
ncbi:glycine cleavage system aminomethyltransferase GcvT [soil metagenome]